MLFNPITVMRDLSGSNETQSEKSTLIPGPNPGSIVRLNQGSQKRRVQEYDLQTHWCPAVSNLLVPPFKTLRSSEKTLKPNCGEKKDEATEASDVWLSLSLKKRSVCASLLHESLDTTSERLRCWLKVYQYCRWYDYCCWCEYARNETISLVL